MRSGKTQVPVDATSWIWAVPQKYIYSSKKNPCQSFALLSDVHDRPQASSHVQDQVDYSSTKKPGIGCFFGCRKKPNAHLESLVSSFGAGVGHHKTFEVVASILCCSKRT